MKKRNLTPQEVTPHVFLRRMLHFTGTGLPSSPYNLLFGGSGQGKNLLNAAFSLFSIALLPILAWGSLFLGTPSVKTDHGQKVSFFSMYHHQNERAELATIQQWLLPASIANGDFNASISASSSTIVAGNSVVYTINYSTGATASNISGAKIVVFLPIPNLNSGLISFNGTPAVLSSALTSTMGGYNYTINFKSPLAAGIQGMMELTVVYPQNVLCDGSVVTATATATVSNVGSDNNSNDNSASVTVSDPSIPWTVEITQDNLRTLGQISNYTVKVKKASGTPFNLSNATVSVTIPAGATVNSCSSCSQSGNTLTWGPTTFSSNTNYAVNLTYDTPTFIFGQKVALSTNLSGFNTTCNKSVTGTDMVMGNIPSPPPPAPNVACSTPTLSNTVIGQTGTTDVTFSNSGNVPLTSFKATVDFPDEAQISAIPAATYSTGGINVTVFYKTSTGTNSSYSFVTSTSTAGGGLNSIPGGEYLTQIMYSFTDPVPAGFMPSSPISFAYTVVNKTVDNATTVNGANPRITDGTCLSCATDAANGSGFGCMQVNIDVTGKYNLTTKNSNCSVSNVVRDPAIGPQNIVKGASTTNAFPQDVVTFTLQFDHCGVDDLTGAKLADVLPSQFTYIAGSSTFKQGLNAAVLVSDPNNVSNTLTWTLPTLLKGDQVANANNYECTTYILSFGAKVNDGTKQGKLTNCFTLAGSVPGNPDAIEVCKTSELQACADVNILPVGPNNPNKIVCSDLTAPFDAIFPQDDIRYKMTWTNEGNFDVVKEMAVDKLPAQFTYTPNSIVYSANLKALIDAYKVGNPSYNPFSATPQPDGTTLLKWDFTGLTLPGDGVKFEIVFDTKIKSATPPGTLTNCFNVNGESAPGQGGNVRMDEVGDCEDITVKPVGPVNTSKTSTESDGNVQPTDEFFYTLSFQNSGAFAVSNLKIIDILPSSLELVQTEAIVYSNIPNPTSFSYDAMTRQLSWEWISVTGADPGNELSNTKSITFKVRVKPGTLANVKINNCFRIDGQGTNIDPRRQTGSGILSPYLQEACSSELSVLTLAIVTSRKGIKGECDEDFVYFNPDGALPPDLNNLNGIGRTVPGGEATYRLQISNPGNIVIQKVVLIDILPFIGDKGVLRVDEDRLTAWRPTLSEPITAPAGVTVYYSVEQNPCRSEFSPAINPSGCTGPNWSTTPPSDISLVQSVKLDFSGLDIGPAQTFSIDWKMYAPFNAPVDIIAWNSYAFQGTRKDNNNKFLTAEPNKVGLAIKRDPKSSLGNYVWIDRNKNGLQDEPASEGINGVKVTLYKTTNMVKGDGDDQLISFTYTVNDFNGNPGYYLFPDLDAGKYYVIFDKNTLPATTTITTPDVNNNGNDNTDSDADVVMGMSGIVTLGLPEQNLSVDMGITPPDCLLNGTLLTPICYDNGTPLNLNDDKVTLSKLTALKTGSTGGSKYTLIIEKCVPNKPTLQLQVVTGLSYNTEYGPYGPYDVAQGELIKVTVIDESNRACRLVDLVLGCSDYGDLPQSYTTSGTNAPQHLITNNLKLGASVDAELDGAPEAMAGLMSGGDDNNVGLVTIGTSSPAGDDENGVKFLTPMVPGNQSCIEVTAMNMNNTAAVLQMWIDWNGNGTFEAGEAVTSGSFNGAGGGAVVPATNGLTNAKLCFDVPADAVFAPGGAAFIRFRLSPSGNLSPNSQTTPIPYGEIEDYKLQLGKIGNLVFEDRNFNGVQDSGEPGISNVSVGLTWLGADGQVGGGDDVTYTTIKTDQNGKYYFCGITDGPGASDNQFKLTFSTPANLTPTRTNQGSNDVKDSDGALTGMDLSMTMETFAFTFPTPTAENSTGDSGTPGVGNFADNQTDETHDQGFASLDYGDLPESGNGDKFLTTMTKGGAVHVIYPNFKLGASIDGERDATANATASGDDATNTGSADDEDGVTFTSPLIPGYNATISVVSMNPFNSTAVLQGWIDWDNSGTLDAGEALSFTSSTIPTSNATTTFTFPVPADAIFNDGMVFARFRLSPSGGLSANGPDKYDNTKTVPQGEVEDYKLNVVKVGNIVWEDYDSDGLQDATEPGIGDVTIQLVWAGPDGKIATTGDNQTYVTKTAKTAAGDKIVGEYYFCGLIGGAKYKLVALTPNDMTPTLTDKGDQTNGGLTDNDGFQTGTDKSMIMTDSISITVQQVITQPTGENSLGDNGTAGVGTFPDNQVNETYDFGFVSIDFGDLPDSYDTDDTPDNSGAQHTIQPGKYLGSCVDAERDAAVDAVAGLRGKGDDGAASARTVGTCTTPNDDENGVEFLTPFVPGYEACVRITYTAIDQPGLVRNGKTYLSAWVDYNGNNQFDNGEQAITDLPLAVGTNVVRDICFTVPVTATFASGAIRSRFRLHCEPGLKYNGPAIGGEVEDYHIPVAKVGNYAWYDNDLRGDQTTTDNPVTFLDEKGANGLSVVLIWYGPDGQFGTADDRTYIKKTATGTQGEVEDEGGTADGIYYFCGLQEGSFRMVPLKYATKSNTGVNTLKAADGTTYDISDAKSITQNNGGTTNAIRQEFEISRKILTIANNPPATDLLDSDDNPIVDFSIPNLVKSGLIKGENGVGDVPKVYNYPDTLTNLSFDLGLVQEPNVEVIQSIMGVDFPASGKCGNFNVIVDVCIQNTAGSAMDYQMGVPLNNIFAAVNLKKQLGVAFVSTVGTPKLIKTNAERGYPGTNLVAPQSYPSINTNFNGSTDTVVLKGNDGLLWPGEKVLVRYVFEVSPESVPMMQGINLLFQMVTTGNAINYQGKAIPDYYNGGIQFVAKDLSDDSRKINGTYYDEDDPTNIGDCWKKVKSSALISLVNFTADKNCKVNITPSALVDPYFPECDTVSLPLGGYYRFNFQDMNGNPLTNPLDAKCFAGMKLKYLMRLVNKACEPRWAEMLIEDKTAPVAVPNFYDKDLLCTDINTVLNNPKTIGIAGGDSGKDGLLDLGLYTFVDNCGECNCPNPTLANGRVKWSDKVVYYPCDPNDRPDSRRLVAKIFRTWSAVDCFGNTTTVVQEINFVRPALGEFKFLVDYDADKIQGTVTTGIDPDYDAVTTYDVCGAADLSIIRVDDYVPYIISPLTGKKVFLTDVSCFYSVNPPVDVQFPVCQGKGVKVDRTIEVFDWCAGKVIATYHTLIKIGDFRAPKLTLPAKLPIILSTGPMDCTASFQGNSVAGLKAAFGLSFEDCDKAISIATKVRTLGKIVYGIVVDQTTWFNVDYRVVNGYTIGLPVGRHKLIISAYDGCYNTLTDSVDFYVLDRIAPVMKCNDQLTVTLSNANGYTRGYARVDAKDIDEGSTDNCKLDWVRVRRSVPASCYQSFIDKGYDTNGNGKLDTLDGFDNNGNGKLEPALLETFRNKNGTLMTPLQSFVEFFCCDAGSAVRTELWGKDGELIVGTYNDAKIVSGGNLNFCWQDIVIEDKVAPICMAPLNVTIDCLDKNLQYLLGDAKNKSIIAAAAKIFGDVIIMSGSDCANLDTTYTVTTDLKCGYGTIKRSWTLTKKTSKGPLSTTCSQTIYVRPVHEYNICFPKDAVVNCRTKLTADTVKVDELACDILAVNVSDKRYAASDDECYKIFRTYTVINWCTYDDRCGDPMSPENVYTVDRKWGEFGKYATYVLVRQWEEIAQRRRGYGHNQFFLSRDTIVDNWNTGDYGKLSNQLLEDKDDERIFPESDCKGWGEERRYRDRDDREHRNFIHSWMYTQIIKVYDTERPVVKLPKLPTCPSSSAIPGAASINFPIDPASCVGPVSIAFKGTDNCSTALELEPSLIKVESSNGSTKLPSDYEKTWSTARVASDSFKVSIKGFASGSYNLIVVLRDECGNLSVATRIPFTVGDCKAPVPICINGLSTDLMPVKGGGAMTVWAKDFIASPAYDCNGQGNSTDPKDGPNTKDGLKLITKYSVNRLGKPVSKDSTSITVTCADAGKQVPVEIHAWDEKGNHDFCVTYLNVNDNNKVCPSGPGSLGDGEIAGLIQTEAKQSVQGVSVELSGKAVKGMSTASDGKYDFTGLEKGYDYTVTPSLDANPLNGVSTFDLVLMQKHILGIQPLDSPYKMIAADINNSKSITTLDLILLRKLILNLDTKFTANTSWRFVDAAYRFPNPSNPWSESFPEISSINNLNGKANADFVAVKIGDVNGNASPTSVAAAQPRKAGKLELSTEEQRIEGGQEYRVDIRAKDLKTIEGYQFTLELDRNKVDLVDIDYGVAKAENFGIFQREGIITTSWNRKGGAENNDDAILFTLHLQGKGAAKLSEALTISSRYTANEAYQEGGDYLSVAMSYTKAVVISDQPELLQNTPNPFADQTQIGFYLPQATEGRLTIRDAKGSIVYRLKADYNKGWNQVTIKQSDLKAAGVLYYTLETPDFTATKKMVLLNK